MLKDEKRTREEEHNSAGGPQGVADADFSNNNADAGRVDKSK